MRNRSQTASHPINYKVDRNKQKIEDLRKKVQIKISALNAIKSNIYRQESDTKLNADFSKINCCVKIPIHIRFYLIIFLRPFSYFYKLSFSPSPFANLRSSLNLPFSFFSQ